MGLAARDAAGSQLVPGQLGPASVGAGIALRGARRRVRRPGDPGRIITPNSGDRRVVHERKLTGSPEWLFSIALLVL